MSFYRARQFLARRFRLVLLSVLQAPGLPFSDVMSEEVIQSAFDRQDVSFAEERCLYTGGYLVGISLSSVAPQRTAVLSGRGVACAREKGAENGARCRKRCQASFSCYFSAFRVLGRPWGRVVDCKPSRRTTISTHAWSPSGRPRSEQVRTAFNSCGVSGSLTRWTQLGNLGIGQALSSLGSGSGRCSQRQSEPHRHCSARLTRPARNAFLST